MHTVSWSLVYQAHHTQLCTSEAVIVSLHTVTVFYNDGTDRECDVQFAENGKQAGMKGLDSYTLVTCYHITSYYYMVWYSD